jgi:hypothetical protein
MLKSLQAQRVAMHAQGLGKAKTLHLLTAEQSGRIVASMADSRAVQCARGGKANR